MMTSRTVSLFFIFFMLLVAGRGKAQVIPKLPIKTYAYDTNYVVNYDKLLAVRLVLPRRFYSIVLEPAAGKKLKYRPNIQTAVGLGFTYRWLAVDFVVSPNWNPQRDEKYGETKEFNMRGRLYLKHDITFFDIRNYRGLYISNPQDFENPWDGAYPQRPDVRTTYVSLGYTYIQNAEQFSWRSVFQMDGLMRKSAGSLMYSAALQLNFTSADSSLVPANYLGDFPPEADFTKLNTATLRLNATYAHIFLYRKFFLALSAGPGLALNVGNMYGATGRQNPKVVNFLFDTQNSIGYNSRRWYAGLTFSYTNQPIGLTDNLKLRYRLGEFRLYVGYRIHAPYVVYSVIKKMN